MLSLLLFICELLKCICNALQQARYLGKETNLKANYCDAKRKKCYVDDNTKQGCQDFHVATPFLFAFIVQRLSSTGKQMIPGVTKHA